MRIYQLKDPEDWDLGGIQTALEPIVVQEHWRRYYDSTEEEISVKNFIEYLQAIFTDYIIDEVSIFDIDY